VSGEALIVKKYLSKKIKNCPKDENILRIFLKKCVKKTLVKENFWKDQGRSHERKKKR